MKVYLVARGEYSDYEVLGVFSSKENVQAYIDSCDADYYTMVIDGPLYVDTLLTYIEPPDVRMGADHEPSTGPL